MDYDRLYPDEKDRTFELGGHSTSRTPSNRSDQNKRLKNKIQQLQQQVNEMRECLESIDDVIPDFSISWVNIAKTKIKEVLAKYKGDAK